MKHLIPILAVVSLFFVPGKPEPPIEELIKATAYIRNDTGVASGFVSKSIKTDTGYTHTIVSAAHAMLANGQEDPVLDVAFTVVHSPTAADAMEASDRKPLLGERLYSCGHPLGIHVPIVAEGFMCKYDTDEPGCFWLSVPAASGSSGSPVMDESGKVVGIVVAVMICPYDNLAFCVGFWDLAPDMKAGILP